MAGNRYIRLPQGIPILSSLRHRHCRHRSNWILNWTVLRGYSPTCDWERKMWWTQQLFIPTPATPPTQLRPIRAILNVNGGNFHNFCCHWKPIHLGCAANAANTRPRRPVPGDYQRFMGHLAKYSNTALTPISWLLISWVWFIKINLILFYKFITIRESNYYCLWKFAILFNCS